MNLKKHNSPKITRLEKNIKIHTKNGAQDQMNEVPAFKYAASLRTLISFSRIFCTCSSKLGSHAYNLSTLIPLSISFISFTRSSLFFICRICRVLTLFAITPLTGIKMIMTAKPKIVNFCVWIKPINFCA